jgi:hypothetical protein
MIARVGSSYNASYFLYLRGAWFESLQGHRLHDIVFVIFLLSSGKCQDSVSNWAILGCFPHSALLSFDNI